MIDWKPIAELPDELKDGRVVLLWQETFGAVIAVWVAYAPGTEPQPDSAGDWHDDGGSLRHLDVTHYAEINEPGPAKPTA